MLEIHVLVCWGRFILSSAWPWKECLNKREYPFLLPVFKEPTLQVTVRGCVTFDTHLGNLRFLAGPLLPWVGECWGILAYFPEDVWYYSEIFTSRCFTWVWRGGGGNCWCVAGEFLVTDQGHPLCCSGGERVEGCSGLTIFYCCKSLPHFLSWETASEFPYFHCIQGEKSPATELSALETLRLKWTLIHSASIYYALCSGKREEDVIFTSGSL